LCGAANSLATGWHKNPLALESRNAGLTNFEVRQGGFTMLTIRKSAITLGILGAMIATTATPSLARSKHVRAPATEYSQQTHQYDNGRGAFAASPFGYNGGRGFDAGDGYDSPRATSRPSQTWDDYAKRWDGGN
jgi:hypothetical protein